MFIRRVSVPLFFTAPLLFAAALPAVAQPAAAPAAPVYASSLIRVSACQPALNLMSGGGWAGYAPGYPGFVGGGYWPDAYGAGFYQPPVTTADPQLAIDYTNVSPKTMHNIEFGLIVNGILTAEVRDVGTFSPHAEIKHRFGVSANIFPIRTGLPRCVPLRITFADGSKWRNPRLPPKNHNIYRNP